MKNIIIFSSQQKYPSGVTALLDTLTLEKTFSRLLTNFIDNKDDSFVLLETIVLSCIAIEAIIRESLSEINPALILEKIDPVQIAIVSNKRDKLINHIPLEASEIKTANLSILLDRYFHFYKMVQFRKGIEALFSYRNKILHVAQENTIDKHKVTLLLTRSIFPFIKEHVSVKPDEWSQVEKIRKVAHSAVKAELVRKLIHFQKLAVKISEAEIKKLLSGKPDLLKEETILAADLLCPACKYQSVTLVSGVDFDWNPDGVLESAYYVARCRVCECEFDNDEFEEITENPEEYFEPEEEEWTNIIREKEADITDYISYEDL